MRALFLLALLFSVAARADDDFDVAILKAPARPPTIASFTAGSPNIVRGQSSTLVPSVTGAASCSIDQGVGAVDCTTGTTVSPTATTTYTLTATSDKGKTSTATATVTLYPYRIPEDGNTVCHVWWDGASIQRSGCTGAWTMNGTVPQVAASGTVPAGAGTFSSTIYYSQTSTTAAWSRFSGSFMVKALVKYNTTINTTNVWFAATNGSSGFDSSINSTGVVVIANRGSTGTATTVNTAASGTVNFACVGRSGGNILAKLNLGSIVSQAATQVQSVGDVFIGKWYNTTAPATQIIVLEVMVTTTATSDASCIADATIAKAGLGASANHW